MDNFATTVRLIVLVLCVNGAIGYIVNPGPMVTATKGEFELTKKKCFFFTSRHTSSL